MTIKPGDKVTVNYSNFAMSELAKEWFPETVYTVDDDLNITDSDDMTWGADDDTRFTPVAGPEPIATFAPGDKVVPIVENFLDWASSSDVDYWFGDEYYTVDEDGFVFDDDGYAWSPEEDLFELYAGDTADQLEDSDGGGDAIDDDYDDYDDYDAEDQGPGEGYVEVALVNGDVFTIDISEHLEDMSSEVFNGFTETELNHKQFVRIGDMILKASEILYVNWLP
jgi:hypothetical protein